jgi:hypothetical protein
LTTSPIDLLQDAETDSVALPSAAMAHTAAMVLVSVSALSKYSFEPIQLSLSGTFPDFAGPRPKRRYEPARIASLPTLLGDPKQIYVCVPSKVRSQMSVKATFLTPTGKAP